MNCLTADFVSKDDLDAGNTLIDLMLKHLDIDLNTGFFPSLMQLAGTGVLAVGLWLRFDTRTEGLFSGDDSPTVFFTGKAFTLHYLL